MFGGFFLVVVTTFFPLDYPMEYVGLAAILLGIGLKKGVPVKIQAPSSPSVEADLLGERIHSEEFTRF